MNSLITHWREASLDAPPYVHPDDHAVLQRAAQVDSYSAFVEALEAGKVDSTAFHLSLLPVPYLGDLENADVIILLLNPGLHASDYLLEEKFPEFRDHLRAVIWQDRKTHPFLDTRWAWTSGFDWWQGKLRGVARLIASERFDGHYGRALQSLASRVAVVELCPYHSATFGRSIDLPSTREALAFAKKAAESGDRKVIVTRKVREWALPPSKNVIAYSKGLARGASLGPDTPGGRAILSAYGIDVG